MSDFEKRDKAEPGVVEKTAAEWVLRQQQGLSPKQEKELGSWLRQDARHAQVFAETEETALMLDRMRFRVPACVTDLNKPSETPKKTVSFLRIGLAVAAVLVLGVFVGRQMSRIPAPVSESTGAYVQTASTAMGELKKLELPDGSVVTLNTNTTVEVAYQKSERRVKLLCGEAFFSVAKDSTRPFWVQAGPVAVRAVGTAFNVRMRADMVNVLVTEGKVRVAENEAKAMASDLSGGPVLAVGNLAEVPLNTKPSVVPEVAVITPVDPRTIKSVLAWQEGRLEFFDTPLSEVVTEFNRYNRHKIVISDPALASRRFGGAFASRQIEPLLELLEQSFGVISEERGDETHIRLAK